MYLATEKDGIVEVPEKKRLKALFCKHRNVVSGEQCSKNGMRRISGQDTYVVCADCGTILGEWHINY
jgi:hypothetical protein